MIMILKYELLKLLSRKTYVASIFIFIILALFLSFLTINTPVSFQNHRTYLEYINTKEQSDVEKKISLLNEEIEYYQRLQEYQRNLKMPLELANQAIITDVVLQQQYADFKVVDKDLVSEIENRVLAKKYLEQIHNYPLYIQNIQQSSTSTHMKEAYTDLQDSTLTSINYLSIEAYVNQTSISIVSIIFMIITVFFVFDYERETNMKEHLLLSKNGNKKTYFLKGVVCLVVISLFVILTTVAVLLLYNGLYGFSDLQSPIQAVPSLYESPYVFTIMKWLLLDVFLKIIMLVGVMAVFIACYTFIRNNKLSIVIIFGLYSIGFFLYTYINPYMTTSFYRYINLYAWLQTSQLLSSYITFPIFDMIVTNMVGFVIIMFCFIVVGIVALLYLSKSTASTRTITIRISLFNGKHTCHILHELHKSLLMNKGVIVLVLLCIGFGYHMYQIQSGVAPFDQTLISMYDTYGGKLTDDKIELIEKQKQIYDQKEQEFISLQKNYKETGINKEEYYLALETYNNSLTDKLSFASFYKEYSNRVDDYVVYNKGFNGLFAINNSEREVIYSLIAIIAITVLLAPTYTLDQKNDENILYNLTKKGGKTRNRNKQIVGILYISVIYFIIFGSDFLNFNAMYSIKDWQAPIASILRMNSEFTLAPFLNDTVSLGTYFFVIQAMRLLGMLTFGYLVLLISKYSKHSLIVIVVSFSLILIPAILSFFGFSTVSIVSIFDSIGGAIYLQSGDGVAKVISMLIILGISIIMINRKINTIY